MRFIYFLILFVSNACFANYYVLDTDLVVSESKAFVSFKKTWEEVNEKYKVEIENYEQKIRSLEKDMISQGGEKKKKQAHLLLGEYEVAVQKLLQQRSKILDKAMFEALEKIRLNLAESINDYAAEKQIDLIFAKSQLVFFHTTYDITPQILDLLNKKFPKVNVKIEEQ